MTFLIIALSIIFILVIVEVSEFIKESIEREKQNYTEDGYPKIPVLVENCDNAPRGIEVYISSDPQNLMFKGNGIDKIISHKDILDITLKDVEQKAGVVEFSHGRAILGVILFGRIGAVAGLTGKEKGQKFKRLGITYKEKDAVKYMSFVQTNKQKGNTIEWSRFLEKSTNEIKQVINGEYVIMKNKDN
jgi:hypothetical protein